MLGDEGAGSLKVDFGMKKGGAAFDLQIEDVKGVKLSVFNVIGILATVAATLYDRSTPEKGEEDSDMKK